MEEPAQETMVAVLEMKAGRGFRYPQGANLGKAKRG